ncbi:MAG: hypothetical protein GX624_03535 [Actinobacteria bacterium]|nr:hypothetical protein [Actinomycetota bacterium]
MSRFDDHVIPYEEVARRRRAIEEAQRDKGVIREVKISDAMSHLLDEAAAPEEEGPTPAHLRDIVERDFLEGEEPGRGERADATPGPRKVPDAHESGRGRDDGADPSRTTEDEETRRR